MFQEKEIEGDAEMKNQKIFVNTNWNWDECSMRNCVNCKVFPADEILYAFCGKGKSLSRVQRVALKGQKITARRDGATLTSILCFPKNVLLACRNCPDFEHDIPY